MTSWAPLWLLGLIVTLADSNGHFNKILLQLTERKRRRSGAKSIFHIHHICKIAALLAGSQPYGL